MREIKFRAWDEPSKSFVEDVTDLSKARNYEQPLMQFTGLKDKNGKEIYEGDIVTGGREPIVIFEVLIGYSGGEDYGWCFKSNIGTKRTYIMDKQTIELVKVIGNIYENPKLVQK